MKGTGASPGVAYGTVVQIADDLQRPLPPQEARPPLTLNEAIGEVKRELDSFREALEKLGKEEEAAIFSFQMGILNDPTILSAIDSSLSGGSSQEQAVVCAFSQWEEKIGSLADEVLRERSKDLQDLRERLLNALYGRPSGGKGDVLALQELPAGRETAVIFAGSDLYPSRLVEWREKMKGIILEKGTQTSHTSILARALKIPAVIKIDEALKWLQTGRMVLLNGSTGEIILDPSESEVRAMKDRDETAAVKEEIAAVRQRGEGSPVKILANLHFPHEAEKAIEYGADGIGLFRTEFLYMANPDFTPEEEESAYREVIQKISPGPVTFRLLDLGGDKRIPTLEWPREGNPALGWRGIRVLLDSPLLLQRQLGALLRAKAERVMLPMVSTIEEVREFKEIFRMAYREIRGGSQAKIVEIGIMVEVPSVALSIVHFAREVDFLSIGSNDLTQYLLARDREGGWGSHPSDSADEEDHLFLGLHPAVLKVISSIARAGEKLHKGVSLCGSLGSDPLALPLLLGLGLKELSMEPEKIPIIRRVLGALPLKKLPNLARQCLKMGSHLEVRDRVERFLKRHGAEPSG